MLVQIDGGELAWRFDGGVELRFPVAAWVLLGDRPASVSSLTVEDGGAAVEYDGGRIALRLDHAPDLRTGALVQTLVLRARAHTPRLLLDVRAVPRLLEPLDWLTVPGLFYGDNDLTSDRVEYPRGMARDWSSRADASPCPGVHLAGVRWGHAAFLEHDRVELEAGPPIAQGHGDVLGVGWKHGPDRSRAIRFTFPCQEEPHTYPTPDRLRAPLRPRVEAPAGMVLRLRIHHFVTPGGRGAYHRAARRMAERARTEWRARRFGPGAPSAAERIAGTAGLFAGCMRDAHFEPGVGFSHRVDEREVHAGWSGGFAAVEAGLVRGAATSDAVLFRQAEEMADFVCRTGVSRLGYFMAEYRRPRLRPSRSWRPFGDLRAELRGGDGAWRGPRWYPHVAWGKATGLHVRHACEGAFFLARLLRREAAAGRARPAWRRALQSNLEAALRDQREDGAFPIELDPSTGAILDWEGATPAGWIGALALGAGLAAEEGDTARAARWRAAAERAGDYYAEQHVHAERFFGGPYDAHRAPNMEDAYDLLDAYAELFRATEAPRFLGAAVACADHLLAWRYTFDVVFPPGTICRAHDVSTFATAPASVRNRHLQNWDTVAAPALADVSSWTGDPWYRQAAVDHLVQSCQLVERGSGALGIPLGGQSEQWYGTEFRWFGSFGPYGKGNLWKVSVVLPKAGFLTAATLLAPFE